MANEEICINWPTPQASNIPWKAPPAPQNPALNGLLLAATSFVVSKLPFVQGALYKNAGFASLRDREELHHSEPRYDPTVIRSTGAIKPGVDCDLAGLLSEDWEGKKPASKVHPSVLDYHEAYKSGEVTPTAVAKVLLPLIRKDVENPTQHAVAFLQVREDLVLKAAEASTKRWKEGKPLSPLDGIPVSLKDEVDLTGYKKCYGSKIDYTDKNDSTSYCIRKWEEAGVIIMGKTNMHEFGSDITNNNANHGTPLNPNNPNYYTGGSSGGSAYTVAAGLVPLSEGNDGGGSIRIPANYCGVYGLKPSHGRVSRSPSVNLAKSTAVSGPIAANMVDLEIGYRTLAHPDATGQDAALFIPPKPISLTAPRPKILGIHTPWFADADPLVKQACEATIAYLTTERGYKTVEISLPLLSEGQTSHAISILSELCTGIDPANTHLLTPPNRIVTSLARHISAVDLLQGQRLRNLLMQHLAALFAQHPGLVIVTPTVPAAGWRIEKGDIGYGFTNGNKQIRNMEYVWLANFSGCPALSAPCGYAPDPAGPVPIGIMGMSEWCAEDALLAFGYDCERHLHDEVKGGRSKPVNWVDVLALAEAEGKV